MSCACAGRFIERLQILLLLVLQVCALCAAGHAASNPEAAEYKSQFLKLCDMACADLNKELTPFSAHHRSVVESETHHDPFYIDAYAIRALGVAYDVTGEKRYVDTCTRWADRVIGFQEKMIPEGIYYMNYAGFREPGHDAGNWFVADTGSVAMAILATSVRAKDDAMKKRCLKSVESYATAVIQNCARENGGVTNGSWWGTDGPWWCSTATFGSASHQLYRETKRPEYLKVACGTTDWLASHDWRQRQPPEWDALNGLPSVAIYCGENYASAVNNLSPEDSRRHAIAKQIATIVEWLANNQQGRGAKNDLNYRTEADYMPGMPYLMYVFARELPEYKGLDTAADQELKYVHQMFWKDGDPKISLVETWEFMAWMMLSYAEKVSPGSLYRCSNP
jgi:hypothetical protein